MPEPCATTERGDTLAFPGENTGWLQFPVAADGTAITPAEPECVCHRCIKEKDLKAPGGVFPLSSSRMILCPVCGNKRCPKASDHRLACTGSNEPGQDGSIFPASTFPPTQKLTAIKLDSTHAYNTSRDYFKLSAVMQVTSVLCMLDCNSERTAASTVFAPGRWAVLAFGRGYIGAGTVEDFVKACESANLEFVLPDKI